MTPFKTYKVLHVITNKLIIYTFTYQVCCVESGNMAGGIGHEQRKDSLCYENILRLETLQWKYTNLLHEQEKDTIFNTLPRKTTPLHFEPNVSHSTP